MSMHFMSSSAKPKQRYFIRPPHLQNAWTEIDEFAYRRIRREMFAPDGITTWIGYSIAEVGQPKAKLIFVEEG